MATLASIAEQMETTPAAPFLRLAGLRRVFGAHVAVRALDLAVGAGEYLTLLGPSGCGKTTTLRMIAGFLAPSGGQLVIDGQDITRLPPERRPVNTVFQDYALFPHLTVRQNVEYGLRVRKVAGSERRARVDELLARVELTALAERYPRSLSGGQQQRVALARALVCRPRLLLLDEPLGALDARLRVTMQGLLKSLQRAFQIAFIHVTHDQGEALALSDRVAVMRDGAIAQVGTPAALYQRPANPFVADFLGTTNLLEGRCVRQEGEVVTLAVGALAMRGITSSRFAPGDAAVLSVRPAAITLHPSSATGTHSPLHTLCSGEIVDATYRGEDWLLRVRCDGADFLVASAGGAAQVGQPVQIAWAAHAAWVMQP